MARYLPTGALDLSFGGGDGLVTTDFGRLEDFFQGVTLDSADRIVVAATTSSDTSCTDCDVAVARFTTTGTLDADFGGGDGKVITDMGSGLADYASDLAVDPSDRIVLAGTARREDAPDFSDFAVVRYTESGELDASFDGDGRVTTDFDGVTQSGRAVALDGLGRVVVSGETAVGTGFALAATRYLGTGALDTSFSGDGRVVTDVAPGENTFAPALVVDASNRVLLGGTVLASPPEDLVLARYLTDGTLDPGFGGGDGIALTPTPIEGRASDMTIDDSGRIVVAGSWLEYGAHHDAALLRYLTDGSLDASFGVGGLVQTDFRSGEHDYASGVGLDADGRILIAGASGAFGDYDFAVARFQPEGTFVPPPKQPQPPSEPSEEPTPQPLGPSTPPALPLPLATPKAKAALKCKKGFQKKKVRGKMKCVKKKRRTPDRSSRMTRGLA